MKRIVCLITALMIVTFSGCNDTSRQTYEEFAAENGVMPTIGALGDCRSVQTLKFETIEFLPAYTLIAEYDAEHFAQAVQEVDKTYTFQEYPMIDKVEENALEPTFSLDGYDFRILALDRYSKEFSEFPEEIYFIGVNKKERKIAYVYFYDESLDFADSLEYILTEYCSWGTIK